MKYKGFFNLTTPTQVGNHTFIFQISDFFENRFVSFSSTKEITGSMINITTTAITILKRHLEKKTGHACSAH